MRRLILAALVLGYAGVFVRMPSFTSAQAFDPLDRRGREVERAIEEGRFAEALPIARELQQSHPDATMVTYWLAEVYGGLGNYAEEATALEHVLQVPAMADAVCPELPLAYLRSGNQARTLDAYERCAASAPDDPERWFDLGEAYAAAGRGSEADSAYARSRALDASNPRLPTAGARASVPLEEGH